MKSSDVLVVDDGAPNLKILLSLQTANDVDAARRLQKDSKNDARAILPDRMMLRLDGIGLLKRMKGNPHLTGNVPAALNDGRERNALRQQHHRQTGLLQFLAPQTIHSTSQS